MGRIYYVSTGYQTKTGADDLLEIQAGAANPFILRQIVITQSTDYGDALAGVAQVQFKRGADGYTSGTDAGGNPTVAKQNHADAAESFDQTYNDSSNASSGGGTLTVFYEEAMNLQGGMIYQPEPDLRPYFGPSEGLVISITGTPGDGSVDFSVVATVEEL